MTDDDDLTSTTTPDRATSPSRTTTTTDLHDLLTRVAAGEVDPVEAARRLDEHPAAPTLDHVAAVSHQGVTGVLVEAAGVRLQLIADPTVSTAVADGVHRVRQEQDRLVFELPGREDRFEPGWHWGRLRTDWPYWSTERVALRVNPALAVQLELQACEATVRGLRAPLEVRCLTSAVTVLDHDGPLRAAITTGSAKIEARLTGPDDSVSADMSSVKLTLLPGSDTTLTTRAEMGSLKVSGAQVRHGHDELSGLLAAGTAVAGSGAGAVAVSVRMGSTKVSVL